MLKMTSANNILKCFFCFHHSDASKQKGGKKGKKEKRKKKGDDDDDDLAAELAQLQLELEGKAPPPSLNNHTAVNNNHVSANDEQPQQLASDLPVEEKKETTHSCRVFRRRATCSW